MGKHRSRRPHNSSKSQSVTFWGLVAAISSFGAVLSFPQTAQAAPGNLSTASQHSSNSIAQSDTERKGKILGNFKIEASQEQAAEISTIKIHSKSNLGTNPVTTISIPQLPSLTLAQNTSHKTITKQIYTVRSGDTIKSIARLYGISTEKLIEANKIKNPGKLSVNSQLVIPVEEKSQVSPDLSFSASSPKRTSRSEINPLVTRDISTNLSTNKDEVENVRDPYISGLRADIDKLRNQFQSQYGGEDSSTTTTRNSSLVRRESVESSYIPSAVSVAEAQEDISPRSDNNSSEEFRISSAIRPTEGYNRLFNAPSLREGLRPKLPPLSAPEEYLPGNESLFDGYMWPAQGTFTSGYGWRWGRMHKGIDIAAPIGTPIVAAATGEVIFAGWNSGGYGKLVKVQHPDGSVTFYAHNNRILVRKGQKIKQGQQIAEMGSTGFSTGPHLHFEIRPNGNKAVNPIALLPKK
ncbi:metalloendopeptidase-like membrane protein [Xenococcus sp. PCC 7305]|uniref:M23 family metallopeptidase n=1 Tax=Xenococcus sp. PCC 7305 TaxID=102125 RepID=UPI0002AC3FBC|nr:M23 family metallopeptidase [Xenococcus sp. PCC 7305]ELS03659.1 metalloendopeptidase-like membrane protein [Xenococcus sp. PCC 7305]